MTRSLDNTESLLRTSGDEEDDPYGETLLTDGETSLSKGSFQSEEETSTNANVSLQPLYL